MALPPVPYEDTVPTELRPRRSPDAMSAAPGFCLVRADEPPLHSHEASPGPWNSSMGCVDWQSTQWQASFKDIPFAVDTDTRSGGRRLHVHEFPDRELWLNEDLGRLRQQVDVVGYVFGDRSDEWAEILFAACTSAGSGTLYLPMRVPMPAFCVQAESTFNAERMGRIDFNMRFSLDAEASRKHQTRWLSPTALRNDVSYAAERVDRDSRALFDMQFTAQPASSVSRATAATMIRSTANKLRATAMQSRLDDASNSKLAFVVQHMHSTADELAHAQRTTANTLSKSAFAAAQLPPAIQYGGAGVAGLLRASTDQVIAARGGAHEGFGGLVRKAFDALQAGAKSHSDLAVALNPLTELGIAFLATAAQPAAGAASVKEELRLAEVTAGFVRRTALARQCLAGVMVAPAEQPDASLTRGRLVTLIDDEIRKVGNAVAVRDSLRELRSSVVRFVGYFSQGGAGSKTIRSPYAAKPLAVHAAKLGSGYTDVQLMRHNGVEHPLFGNAVMVAIRT